MSDKYSNNLICMQIHKAAAVLVTSSTTNPQPFALWAHYTISRTGERNKTTTCKKMMTDIHTDWFRFVSFVILSICFVPNCCISFRFVSFRFVLFLYVLFCFFTFCFVSLRFVSFRFVLFRFVLFRFNSYCFLSF